MQSKVSTLKQNHMPVRRLVFQPAAHYGMQRGINLLANAIRPTLGPTPRTVAMERVGERGVVDVLDNGGEIARLTIQLADRDADMGAMLLRESIWRLLNEVGDGTATAAVLYQSIFNQGLTYIASGGNGVRLQKYLEKGSAVILEQLNLQVSRVRGKAQLAQIAESICHDTSISKYLGEVLDMVGEYGRVEIRSGRSREVEREYVEGMYWDFGLWSRELLVDPIKGSIDLENAAIVLTDLEINDAHQLVPVLARAKLENVGALVIICDKLSEYAMGILMANRKPGSFDIIAVRTPGWGAEEKAWALSDLAFLTGARSFVRNAGDTLEQFKAKDFGYARRARADLRTFGIVGGKGNSKALRQHISAVRAAFKRSQEPVVRGKLRERIGKLLGGSATLWVGAATEREIKARVQLAERTAEAVRGAMTQGVLPGGGAALLNCIPILAQMERESDDPEERAAYRILASGLSEPTRTIISNAGYDVGKALGEIYRAGANHGFDALTGQVVNMMEAGILDAAATQKAAVYSAIHGAATALTIDVLVHHHKPPKSITPNVPLPAKKL